MLKPTKLRYNNRNNNNNRCNNNSNNILWSHLFVVAFALSLPQLQNVVLIWFDLWFDFNQFSLHTFPAKVAKENFPMLAKHFLNLVNVFLPVCFAFFNFFKYFIYMYLFPFFKYLKYFFSFFSIHFLSYIL